MLNGAKFFGGLLLAVAFPAVSYGALAVAGTGLAATSAHLSTNPTIRKQQLLVDPATDDPLTLTYARLDVKIHLDMPLGYLPGDIIESITVAPLEHFLVDPEFPMPYYFGEASYNITFSGLDVLIKDFVVRWDVNSPPAPGEVNHAVIDVQYNNLLPESVYNNILATYTVQTNTFSEIRGRAAAGTEYTFTAPNISPATANQQLGVPEPTVIAPLALGVLAVFRRRARSIA